MGNIAALVGSRIREYRIHNRLSQEELADMAKMHPAHFGRIERGEENATLESIEKIIKALNIAPEEFFNFKNDDNISRDSSINKVISYMNVMNEDDRQDFVKTTEMLVKWKGLT